ncbi:MAG: hypothetical protein K8F91_01225, partial [Candidatus Obscuribacterales bacterium]|nr:hypothetical protein [Candidatus Obscuribacterales bacterium]
IKTTDALTLYSSYLYRAKDLGLPGDSRDYALRESRLADCHLIDESYKLAEIAYEKASLLWQHLDNDCNAGIALLRGGYARQRRGKNISDLTEDLEKAVSDIGAAYGMESVYHQVGRMLYREIIRGAHQSDS